MTDVTATDPFAEPRTQPRYPTLPTLSVGAAIGAITAVVGQAFSLAYVAPYEMGNPRPQPDPAQAEDGRDPAW